MTELPDFKQFWDFNNPEVSEKEFAKIMSSAKEIGNMDYYLEVKTQLARTYSLRMQVSKAKLILDEITPLLDNSKPIVRVRYNLEYGRCYNSNQEPENAIPYFKKAKEIAHKNGFENLEVDALHMLGIAAKKPDDQIKWNLIALELVEKSSDKDTKRWLGPLYNNTAWTLAYIGEHEKAKALFEKDYEYRKSIGSLSTALVAKWSIAKMYRELGEFSKSLELQLEIEKERESNNLPLDGYNQEELGYLFNEIKEEKKAKRYFSKAYELLIQDSWIKKNEIDRLDKLKELSE